MFKLIPTNELIDEVFNLSLVISTDDAWPEICETQITRNSIRNFKNAIGELKLREMESHDHNIALRELWMLLDDIEQRVIKCESTYLED